MVQRNRQGLPVARPCALLGLARSSLYYRPIRALFLQLVARIQFSVCTGGCASGDCSLFLHTTPVGADMMLTKESCCRMMGPAIVCGALAEPSIVNSAHAFFVAPPSWAQGQGRRLAFCVPSSATVVELRA